MKILVVDDSIENRALLTYLLEEEGHDTIEADDGEQGIKCVISSDPDLVLMDVMMPVMDGYSSCRAIRELPSEIHLPIIFLTAMGDDDVLTRCLNSGGDDFLCKPYNHLVLLAKISAHLRIRRLTKELKLKKQEQVKLYQRNKLSSIGTIASNIAHEVNGSLQSILLLKNALRRKMADNIPDMSDYNDTLEKIERNALNIGTIVENTKKMARDSKDDAHEAEKIKDVIDEAVGVIEVRLQDKAVKLTINYAPQADLTIVKCQRLQIAQILLNLINNSLEALDNTTDKWLVIDCDSDGRWCYIRVTDSGSGIDKNVAKNMFTPLYSGKDNHISTGLGLSISRDIAHRHDGELAFDNEQSNTSFILKLPAQSN